MDKRWKKSVTLAGIPTELLERMSIVLRLLAHPRRLKIIELLEDSGHIPVHQIQYNLRLTHAATSQHLNAMKRVGLVKSERRGKEVWYRIADPRAVTILNCIRKHQEPHP